jgi:hypothetical protein
MRLVLQVAGTLLTGRSSKSYTRAERLVCTESGCWSEHPESVLGQSGRTGAGHLIRGQLGEGNTTVALSVLTPVLPFPIILAILSSAVT